MAPSSPRAASEKLDPLRHLRTSSALDLEEEVGVTGTRSVTPRAKVTREKSNKTPENRGDAAFSSFVDHSKTNERRHNFTRADTFNTASKLQRDTAKSERKHGAVGDMPINDLLWICEQTFRKEASNLSKEMLAIARAEFTNVTDGIVKDIQEIGVQVSRIAEEVAAPAKVDWLPVHDEFSCQRDQFSFLQHQVGQAVAEVHNGVESLQKHQEQAVTSLLTTMQQTKEDVRDLQTEVMKRSERQVTQVLNVQQCLTAECSQVSLAVQDLQQELQLVNEQVLPGMEAQLTRHVREQPVMVSSLLGKSQEALGQDLKGVIDAVGTMKRDVDVCFVKRLDDFITSMEEQRDFLQERQSQEPVKDADLLRDSGTQTDPPPVTDRSAQTEGKVIVPRKQQQGSEEDADRSKGFAGDDEDKEKKALVESGEALKKKARQALMKPQYCVTVYYKEVGCIQKLAKHWVFEQFTFFVIFLNAIWISIDIDHNEAALLINADPVFQIIENLFCLYFTFELTVRFLAFKLKWNCLRDGWFVFDAILVSLMIIETWIVTLVMLIAGIKDGGDGINISLLRMLRMVKMARLSRMARLLRAIPELLVLVKAVGAAVRSMMVFFLMWLVVIYVFAVVFRQLTDGQRVGQDHFRGVPQSMHTLLVEGIIPDHTRVLNELLDESYGYWPLMVGFVLLTSITLMFMLIGVLTDVIHTVFTSEKEGMVVTAVASRLREAMRLLRIHDNAPLSKMEFQDLLVHPEVVGLCKDIGVNVVVLVDMSDVIFESADKDGNGMTFEHLVEVILNMRGANPATVKDVKEQLRVIKSLVQEAQTGLTTRVNKGFRDMNRQILDLRRLVGDDEDALGMEVQSRFSVAP